MITTRLIFLAVLLALVLFFIYMKFNAPRGPHYRLKLIQFNIDPNVINETGELGKRIFTSNTIKKFMLPWDQNIWAQVDLHENGIVIIRKNQEIPMLFSEIYDIEPLLVHSLFIIGKHFGYKINAMDGRSIILKSTNLGELDVLIDKLCALFPPEDGRAIITDIG